MDRSPEQSPERRLGSVPPNPRRASRPHTLLTAFALLAVLLFSPPAFAQQPKKPRKPPPVEIVKIDLGWGGSSLAADRWQPATVWITSQEKSFTGQLILACQQDGIQKANIYVGPVSTTPGQVTPVEITFSPSTATQNITFTLENGSYRTSVRYAQNPVGNDQPLPRIGLGQVGQIIVLGETSGGRAVSERSSILNPNPNQFQSPPTTQTYDEARVFEQMMPAAVPLVRMPTAWAAYESADIVVCDEEDLAKADPRARAALATWVRSGGRLVMRLDPVGSQWPELLSEESPCVLAGNQQVLTFDTALSSLLPRMATTTLKARTLALTPAGRSQGWKPLFPVTAEDGSGSGSLVAYGPCGLGMVTLIAFEPSAVSPLIDDESIKKVWRTAVAPILPPHARRGGFEHQNMWFGEMGDHETLGAINSSLDSIASVPPIGTGVFWAICMCMLTLALLLGPIDAKVLKRRGLSQHSWFTALCWITLAGLAAVLAPRVMRSAESRATRLVFSDTLCDSPGQPYQTAHYALTGVFAGKPFSYSLTDQQAGSWLKGVSAAPGYYRPDNLLTLPDLNLGIQSDDAGTRAAWSPEIDIPQWSFRTVSDAAPVSVPAVNNIGAAVVKVNGLDVVRLTNVPAGVTVSEMWLGRGTDWYKVDPQGTPLDNQRDFQYSISRGASHVECAAWLRPDGNPTIHSYVTPEGSPASLPWVRERAQAVDTRLATGRWACVCVKLEGLAPNLTIQGVKGLAIKQTTMLRLMTPLETE
jgi:hypothetical protein